MNIKLCTKLFKTSLLWMDLSIEQKIKIIKRLPKSERKRVMEKFFIYSIDEGAEIEDIIKIKKSIRKLEGMENFKIAFSILLRKGYLNYAKEIAKIMKYPIKDFEWDTILFEWIEKESNPYSLEKTDFYLSLFSEAYKKTWLEKILTTRIKFGDLKTSQIILEKLERKISNDHLEKIVLTCSERDIEKLKEIKKLKGSSFNQHEKDKIEKLLVKTIDDGDIENSEEMLGLLDRKFNFIELEKITLIYAQKGYWGKKIFERLLSYNISNDNFEKIFLKIIDYPDFDEFTINIIKQKFSKEKTKEWFKNIIHKRINCGYTETAKYLAKIIGYEFNKEELEKILAAYIKKGDITNSKKYLELIGRKITRAETRKLIWIGIIEQGRVVSFHETKELIKCPLYQDDIEEILIKVTTFSYHYWSHDESEKEEIIHNLIDKVNSKNRLERLLNKYLDKDLTDLSKIISFKLLSV